MAALVCLVVVIAACAPATQTATESPPGTFAPQPRDLPTQPPPVWTESGEVVTLANAAQLAYLGRLDAQGIASTLFAYAFSPEGTRLAGLNNEQLIVWDLITGQIVFNTGRVGALFVFYAADKTEVYTVDNTGLLNIYDAESGGLKEPLPGHPRFNGRTAYYADAGWLAMGGLDGTVKVWDVANRTSMVTIEAHKLQITALAFSADGQRLATGSDDQVVKIWDWRNRVSLSESQATPQMLAFSPDGDQLAVGEPEQVTLWDIVSSALSHTLQTGPRGASNVLVYSPDGQYLIADSGGLQLGVWDPKAGKLVGALPELTADSTSAAFSPNGQVLATAVLGGSVYLWDMSTAQSSQLNRAELAVGTRQMLYADWTPDGFSLMLFDATGPIQVWGIPKLMLTPTAS
jgi:WD40 repeat protein